MWPSDEKKRCFRPDLKVKYLFLQKNCISSIGIIIGACLGTIIYKKQQRMIDDLRSEIQQ